MSAAKLHPDVRVALQRGVVLPAHPLALTAERQLDERRQRALTRYYEAAGAGGVAVGVHTTQFAIHDASIGWLRPVLELAASVAAERRTRTAAPWIQVAGVVGETRQAVREAQLAKELGYDLVLLSYGAHRTASEDALIEHARVVGEVLPLFGFYLQENVGGRHLSHSFWRRFCELESVQAIKIAPFDRYRTLDVVRAVVETCRERDIALYTGNDDQIALDLVTPFRFERGGCPVTVRIVGGLLGHWSVWTRRACELLAEAHAIAECADAPIPRAFLERAQQITDANAAFFDAANGFRGCIAGLHEVLRRQGLLRGIWCLDPAEGLSPGQDEEIERVARAYPFLADDDFVTQHRDAWLA